MSGRSTAVLTRLVAKESQDLCAIRAAICAGANVNRVDKSGESLLTRAIRGCPIDVIKELIEHGANVNFEEADGGTALFSAIFRNDPAVIACLLDAGANPNVIVDRHDTALDIAGCEFDLYLLDGGQADDAEGRAHRRIPRLLKAAGAKHAMAMRAVVPREWLVVFATYRTGLFTRDGLLRATQLPHVTTAFVARFQAWLREYFDTWPDEDFAAMPRDFNRAKHNAEGRKLAQEIKRLVGRSVDVEYLYPCPKWEKRRCRSISRETIASVR